MKQAAFSFLVPEKYSLEDFIVSKANEDAFAWIDSWPDWKENYGLALIGEKACGKTHLAHIWKKKTNAKLVVPKDLKTNLPKQLYFENRPVIFEDIDDLNKEQELCLFHSINVIKQLKKTLVLTGKQDVNTKEYILPDLASRVRSFPLIHINEPDNVLLAQLFTNFFQIDKCA